MVARAYYSGNHSRNYSCFMHRSLAGLHTAIGVASLAIVTAGCASLSQSTQQNLMVQTVLDHHEIAGVGCVLYNDVGKWFVTTPARVTVRKSASPLRIDCQKDGGGWAYEKIESKA